VESDVLDVLSGGELLMSMLTSARSTKRFYQSAYKKAYAKQAYQRAVTSLERKGLLKVNGDSVHISEKGSALLATIQSHTMHINKKWNGHWWILMYDIPTRMNTYRFELRRILLRAGYRKLQHSVWVHPYESPELKEFLRSHRELVHMVRYFNAPAFDGLESLADWKKLEGK
jgi:phenylacetic acid degradation operon negative regulatory protein